MGAEEIRQRLEAELNATVGRIRGIGSSVSVEERAGVLGEDAELTDGVDLGVASEDREMSFATRSRLVERANELVEALDRLSQGELGICIECGEEISPARLRVIPEAQTCVRCRDRLERMSGRSGRF